MSLEVNIRKQLGTFTLDVSFSAQNEVLALLGPSGCGKSMTLRCIAGVERPDAGRIVADGRVLFDSARNIDLPPQQRRVGLLFQNYALFPNMTVEQNLAAGLGWAGRNSPLVAEYLHRFRLEGLEHHLPRQLSGGQQQRAALARMLITRPALLMLDEPFSALDAHLRWELEQEVLAITRSFGGTTLLVSHNRDEVYRIARSIAVYGQGTIDRVGEKWELFRHPRTAVTARLTGCKNIAPARWGQGQAAVPDWGLTLAAPAPEEPANCVGLRAHYLQAVSRPGENVFPYEVVSSIEDTFSVILMVRPVDAPRARPIRWELSKADYAALPPGQLVRIPPEALMPLTDPAS